MRLSSAVVDFLGARRWQPARPRSLISLSSQAIDFGCSLDLRLHSQKLSSSLQTSQNLWLTRYNLPEPLACSVTSSELLSCWKNGSSGLCDLSMRDLHMSHGLRTAALVREGKIERKSFADLAFVLFSLSLFAPRSLSRLVLHFVMAPKGELSALSYVHYIADRSAPFSQSLRSLSVASCSCCSSTFPASARLRSRRASTRRSRLYRSKSSLPGTPSRSASTPPPQPFQHHSSSSRSSSAGHHLVVARCNVHLRPFFELC
jgi:hypothetical protein